MEENVYITEKLHLEVRFFFEQIKRTYQVENINELKVKIEEGDISKEELDTEIYNYITNLSEQIERPIQFFMSTFESYVDITHIVLTGNITLFPGFEKSLKYFSKYDARIGNPLAHIQYKNKTLENIAKNKGSELMTVTGLAMRAI